MDLIVNYLPPGLGFWSALFICLASGFTSLVSAVAGVGGGTILLGLLSQLLPVSALIPVHGVIQLGSNIFRTVLLFKHASMTILVPFIIGSIVGSISSSVLVLQLPVWAIQLGIGLFILYTIFFRVPEFGKGHILFAGSLSGFLTMLFGATGPFVGAFIRTLNLKSTQHIATQAALMSFQHLIKLIVFGFLGFAFAPYMPLLSVMLICAFIGTYTGRFILFQIDQSLFRKILNTVLILLALRLIWQAINSAGWLTPAL